MCETDQIASRQNNKTKYLNGHFTKEPSWPSVNFIYGSLASIFLGKQLGQWLTCIRVLYSIIYKYYSLICREVRSSNLARIYC